MVPNVIAISEDIVNADDHDDDNVEAKNGSSPLMDDSTESWLICVSSSVDFAFVNSSAPAPSQY